MRAMIGAFLVGLLSSAHCVGMCGGFAAAIGAARQPFSPLLTRQLVYSIGRVSTYSFLGACGGFAGLYLSRFNSALVTAQQIFSVAAGVAMLLLGVSILGSPRLGRLLPGSTGVLIAPAFGHFLNARDRTGFFVAGLGNGFLPCGLVYASLAMAVATCSVVKGMTLMASFGLGTVPAMVLIGCGSTLFSRTTRLHVYRVAACLVMLTGVVTIALAFPNPQAHHCATPQLAVDANDQGASRMRASSGTGVSHTSGR